MAYYYTKEYEQIATHILDRVTLDEGDHTVEGGGVVWVTSTNIRGQTDSITVRDWDSSRFGEYDKKFKPHVIIKCANDASANNCLVKDTDGNTLYTFDTDCSATPKYCVLRLTDAGAWELA
jgi:hypothetical protein